MGIMRNLGPCAALLALAAAASTLTSASADGHDHDHEHSECVCEAREHGWSIDCSNMAPVAEAVAFLQEPANNCMCSGHDDEEGEHDHEDGEHDHEDGEHGDEHGDEHGKGEHSHECEEAYHVFQAHHDFCAHDDLEQEWEGLIHDFEACYEGCHIQRQFNPDLEQCPPVDCDNADALRAAAQLLTDEFCGTNECAGEACAQAFQVILMAHDTCDEDTLPTEVEVALHAFEEPCEDSLCNSADGPVDLDAVECDDHDDDHDHEHGVPCFCEADAHGWAIDCSDTAAIDAAEAFLEDPANDCMAGESDACHDAYLLLQAHHDHCPHDTLTTAQEELVHVYEDIYESCFIARQFDPDLPQCPAVDCMATDALEVAAKLLIEECSTECGSDACAAAFQVILMAHDTCDEDTLPADVEVALHAAEDACEDSLCNSVDEPFDPTDVDCDGDDHEDEDDGVEVPMASPPPPPPPTSGAAGMGASLARAAAAAAGAVAAAILA